jgi:transcriptional regulator with XRE-family HTH domain
MPRPLAPPLSAALKTLRTARGWTERELADAAGTTRKLVSAYETGKDKTLSREKLDSLVAVMGGDVTEVDLALLLLSALAPPAEEIAFLPTAPSAPEVHRAARMAARVGLTAAHLTRTRLLGLARARREERARREAARIWKLLRGETPAKRREMIASRREFQQWAVVERLCAESVRAAADDASQALELASLALAAAELVPGDDAWRARLQGYAWAFIANARRVGGDLTAAEEAFGTAWRLWRAGAAVGERPLGGWRLLDLEASLRREQRQFEVAAGLLERALARAPASARAHVLLMKAVTFEQAGAIDAAVAALRQAAPMAAALGEPRDRWVLLFNLLVNLCHLGHHGEAEHHLPALGELTLELGNRLDTLRLTWLTGRIAAGLGRSEQARAAFESVRRTFALLGNAYDAALASLDLAVLLLEAGEKAAVRALAAEMAPIFDAQRVHREALAALALFCDAVQSETATVELARRLVEYLEQARRKPWLRFEGEK